jgi:hypothetical protein
MTVERKRIKQTDTLAERLAKFSGEARTRAEKLPPGPEREAELKRICIRRDRHEMGELPWSSRNLNNRKRLASLS